MPRQPLRKLRPELFEEERNMVDAFITEKQTKPQAIEDDKLREEEGLDEVSITTHKLLQIAQEQRNSHALYCDQTCSRNT